MHGVRKSDEGGVSFSGGEERRKASAEGESKRAGTGRGSVRRRSPGLAGKTDSVEFGSLSRDTCLVREASSLGRAGKMFSTSELGSMCGSEELRA